MEFRIAQKQIKTKKREYLLTAAFVLIVSIIGIIGILGPEPSMRRVIVAAGLALFSGFFMKYLFNDFAMTKQKMLAHRLIVDNHRLIVQRAEFKKAFNLRDIFSIQFRLKKGAVVSIVINLRKNLGFTIKGYEKMDEIMKLLKNAVAPSKIKPSRWNF